MLFNTELQTHKLLVISYVHTFSAKHLRGKQIKG